MSRKRRRVTESPRRLISAKYRLAGERKGWSSYLIEIKAEFAIPLAGLSHCQLSAAGEESGIFRTFNLLNEIAAEFGKTIYGRWQRSKKLDRQGRPVGVD